MKGLLNEGEWGNAKMTETVRRRLLHAASTGPILDCLLGLLTTR